MVFCTTLTKIDFSFLMAGDGLKLGCMEKMKSSKASSGGAERGNFEFQ